MGILSWAIRMQRSLNGRFVTVEFVCLVKRGTLGIPLSRFREHGRNPALGSHNERGPFVGSEAGLAGVKTTVNTDVVTQRIISGCSEFGFLAEIALPDARS